MQGKGNKLIRRIYKDAPLNKDLLTVFFLEIIYFSFL